MNFDRSTALFDKAKELVAGGVSSQIRVNEPADVPLFFTHAKGSKMWDADAQAEQNTTKRITRAWGNVIYGHLADDSGRLYPQSSSVRRSVWPPTWHRRHRTPGDHRASAAGSHPGGGLRVSPTLAQGGQGVSRCYLCVTLNTKTGSSGGRNLPYNPIKDGRDDWI